MVLRLVFCQKKTFQAHYVENNKKTSFVTSKSMDMGKKKFDSKRVQHKCQSLLLAFSIKNPPQKTAARR